MADHIDENTRVTVPETVLSRAAGGETVLLDLGQERYFALDGAATRLWELVTTEPGTTVATLTAALLDEYDVAAEVLSADVRRVLSELAGRGLVELT